MLFLQDNQVKRQCLLEYHGPSDKQQSNLQQFVAPVTQETIMNMYVPYFLILPSIVFKPYLHKKTNLKSGDGYGNMNSKS